ncbi:MAG: methyltransferase domain-containing protein [Anaerolineae bacterium]|jgi:ubiquinone/menaquinone biosynthesis C-methylase UbiE
MTPDIQRELHRELSRGSPARLGFTRKAFQMLPDLHNPRILDVGCGQGGPTLELARLSGGQVTGLDTDQWALHELARRAEEEGLSGRVQAVHRSMFDMDFAEESFDVIWSEGSMHILGFERALGEWRRFISPHGFLVVHEMVWLRPDPPPELTSCWQLAYPGIRTVSEYTDQIPDHGYNLVGHFLLPEDFWWVDYYVPLVGRIRELRKKYSGDQAAQRTLDKELQAADLYREHSHWYGSVFLVMQRGKQEEGRT